MRRFTSLPLQSRVVEELVPERKQKLGNQKAETKKQKPIGQTRVHFEPKRAENIPMMAAGLALAKGPAVQLAVKASTKRDSGWINKIEVPPTLPPV
jgi:hypothetical protein